SARSALALLAAADAPALEGTAGRRIFARHRRAPKVARVPLPGAVGRRDRDPDLFARGGRERPCPRRVPPGGGFGVDRSRSARIPLRDPAERVTRRRRPGPDPGLPLEL